jgi:hypothetical protein
MPVTINGTTGIQTPLGSASAPADSNTTNSNTGLYFPTGTSAAITTNGVSALSIDASQNVSIPTAYSSTSANSANVYVSSTGQLYRSTASATASGTLIRAPQILTSGTSYTTPSNCTSIYVECVGGGGGSGGNAGSPSGSGGGGGGGYSSKYFTVTGSTAYTYAIGAGGTAGNSGGPSGGGTGGSTTFTVSATTITAAGGVGGVQSNTQAIPGSAGGVGSGGDFNFSGGPGGSASTSGSGFGGQGGNSIFGGGGKGSANSAGVNGANYGGGASGPSGGNNGNNWAGAVGAQGVIRVWEYT